MVHASQARLSLLAVALSLAPSAASAQQSAPQPVTGRSLVTVVRLKPEAVNEWQAIQKNEVIPAQKKGGLKSRITMATAVGNAFEYVTITPFPLWAAMDGDRPIVKALGKDGAAALDAKVRRLVLTQSSYMTIRVDSLSITGQGDMVWRVAVRKINPGKMPEYQALVHDEIFPVMKKVAADGRIVGATLAVRGAGAPSGEFTSVTMYKNFAGLDEGDPLIIGAGRETATAINAKIAALSTPIQVVVRRRVPELSF